MVIFTFKGKQYEILPQEDKIQTSKWLLSQFEYAVKTHQFITVENRIINGLKYGWVREITNG